MQARATPAATLPRPLRRAQAPLLPQAALKQPSSTVTGLEYTPAQAHTTTPHRAASLAHTHARFHAATQQCNALRHAHILLITNTHALSSARKARSTARKNVVHSVAGSSVRQQRAWHRRLENTHRTARPAPRRSHPDLRPRTSNTHTLRTNPINAHLVEQQTQAQHKFTNLRNLTVPIVPDKRAPAAHTQRVLLPPVATYLIIVADFIDQQSSVRVCVFCWPALR